MDYKKKLLIIILFFSSFIFSQDKKFLEDGTLEIGGDTIQINAELLDEDFYIEFPQGEEKTPSDNNEFEEFKDQDLSDKREKAVREKEVQKKKKIIIETIVSNIVLPVQIKLKTNIIVLNGNIITNIIAEKVNSSNVSTNISKKIKKDKDEFLNSPIPTPNIDNVDVGYEFVRVRRMVNNRQYEQALLILKKIESVAPNSTRLYNIRGSIYYKLGFYDFSILNWEKSLQINPNQELVRNYLNKIKLHPY